MFCAYSGVPVHTSFASSLVDTPGYLLPGVPFHLSMPRQTGDERVSDACLQTQLRGENGYKKLARHFGWAFETIFDLHEVQEVIVLEVTRGLGVTRVGWELDWHRDVPSLCPRPGRHGNRAGLFPVLLRHAAGAA